MVLPLLLLDTNLEVLCTDTGTLLVELFFGVTICVLLTGTEVGVWTWLEVICVMDFRLVATDVLIGELIGELIRELIGELVFPEAAAELAVDDFDTTGFGLEIPNWVEY